jgi:hypothetical protein
MGIEESTNLKTALSPIFILVLGIRDIVGIEILI